MLGSTQKGTTDITDWIQWFLGCLGRAIDNATSTLSAVMERATFYERTAGTQLNARQQFMTSKLLDDFAGKLTTSKWAKMTKCSQDTALRDIQDLVEKGILVKEEGGGRSTSYVVKG